MCTVTGPRVAEELLKWIAMVGIPREIVTDQGSNFMSRVLRSLCRMLRIKHLQTMEYHPQTNGVVEMFNQTLKNMLWWCMQTDPRWWDLAVLPLLFTAREARQSSLGYAPFDLVYGHC